MQFVQVVCPSTRPPGDKKVQKLLEMEMAKLLGRGRSHRSPLTPAAHCLADKTPWPALQAVTPSLTQGSLADVGARGSSNNKLGVTADLLGTRAKVPSTRRARAFVVKMPQFPSGMSHPPLGQAWQGQLDCHEVPSSPLLRGSPGVLGDTSGREGEACPRLQTA